MNKKGLSGVVTTLLIILLVLVSIGIIWVIVSAFINRGIAGITTEQFTLSLGIKSAKVNYTTGIATVRVARNAGEGELTAIKFIVEDSYNSEVFEESATDFPELAERTYYLDLNTKPRLIIPEVYKISIAPLYINSQTGLEATGGISDSVGDLNRGINITGTQEKPLTNETLCKLNSDCGTDYWINDSETCNTDNTRVLQFKRIFSCVLGFCIATSEQLTKESCGTGTYCYNAQCITEKIPCTIPTVEADCGVSKWVGNPSCSNDQTAIIQDWQEYLCIEGFCEINTTKKTKEECVGEEMCYNGDCFIPLECTQNSDCDLGEICEDGECVTEVVANSGTVRSIWPYNIGEYFDSVNLPTDETTNLMGYYIIFPGSSESRCLKITELVKPNYEGGISYVRLNESQTGIVDGNNYQVWETSYGCTLI